MRVPALDSMQKCNILRISCGGSAQQLGLLLLQLRRLCERCGCSGVVCVQEWSDDAADVCCACAPVVLRCSAVTTGWARDVSGQVLHKSCGWCTACQHVCLLASRPPLVACPWQMTVSCEAQQAADALPLTQCHAVYQ